MIVMQKVEREADKNLVNLLCLGDDQVQHSRRRVGESRRLENLDLATVAAG